MAKKLPTHLYNKRICDMIKLHDKKGRVFMEHLTFKQVSSLEKVFLTGNENMMEIKSASVLRGERYSYQVAFYFSNTLGFELHAKKSGDLQEYMSIRIVGNVPAERTVIEQLCDDDYFTRGPGVFPDVLYPYDPTKLKAVPFRWHSVWITIEIPEDCKAGIYHPAITLFNEEKGISEEFTLELEVIDAILPPQEMIYTQWFHSDCIANYYNVPIFSEEHWTLIDKFISLASYTGVNMLLTPLFTPPLDTAVGGERRTVQLIGVTQKNGVYSFDFSKLDRWIEICLKNNIKYFEMSHLFTQWGAEFTPKIIAVVDGNEEKIFGWHKRADSAEYKEFLDAFLPQFVAYLKNKGIADKTYFHVSDEPEPKHMENYKKAKELIKPHLEGFKIIDALSNPAFYLEGLVEYPIPNTGEAENFKKLDTKEFWVYYCCGQAEKLSNRFFSMPSYRNRIIATQFYKFGVEGFLHWGYNFYNARYSTCAINPFLVTDALGGFPAGDSFSVYPFDEGPIESLRSVVFHEALQDVSAFRLLEQKTGYDEVMKLLETEGKITFTQYPRSVEYIINLRETVNQKIKSFL